jgi:hypothetical protein
MQPKPDVRAAFNMHAWRSYIQRHAVQPNAHKRSFDYVTVVAVNTVTLHVGTSLNYAWRVFVV